MPDGNVDDGAQIYWGVDDVKVAVTQAQQHGAVIVSAPADVGDSIVTATVRNPDGSLVGFIYNPHFAA